MKYRDGYVYQLAQNEDFIVPIYPQETISTEFITLTTTGTLLIYSGYAWDGPSGPCKVIAGLLIPWLRKKYLKTIIGGSLAHDALYQLIRQGHLRETDREDADIALREICIADGMCKVRADMVYSGVRLGGKSSADPKNQKIVYEAP